ncbi:MAG: DUF5362 family protein [Chitinophagaceae bacterium]
MEQQQQQPENLSLFGLSIDTTSKTHLSEAARWAKFLAIVGFIGCALIVLMGIFFSSIMSTMMSGGSGIGYSDNVAAGAGTIAAVMYIIIALVYFFPCLFLFRFATKMKEAIATNEQDTLNVSFQNLKAVFRFIGILTVLGLVLWVLILLSTLIGSTMF